MNKRILMFSLLLLTTCGLANAAQVASTQYFLRYNASSCVYEAWMYLQTGDIQSGTYQGASTNQLTIVVPTGAVVGSPVSNEPKFGSQDGTTLVVTRTSTAASWGNTTKDVNPSVLSGSDVYAFVVSPSGAWWPPTLQGDSILLFSISISTSSCGSGIRLWNNNIIKGVGQGGASSSTGCGGSGVDPCSASFGSGKNYNNGMNMVNSTASGSRQTYNGNRTSSVVPPNPTITAFNKHFNPGMSLSLNVAATPGSSCANSLTYAFSPGSAFSAASAFGTSTNTTGSSSASVTSVPAASTSYSVKVTDPNGCFATASTNIGLPVKLSSFTGLADNCNVNLRWGVASELSNKGYGLEYSVDGSLFSNIGYLERNNSNSGVYTYNYAQPAQKGYYRLKMIDLDGTYSYSQTITVVTNCVESGIKIFPNPTTNVVHIQGIAAGDEVRIMDALGQVVTSAVSPGNIATLDLSPYASGVYSVMISKGRVMTKAGMVVKQ